jgi:para-nitrobenzyl esterase
VTDGGDWLNLAIWSPDPGRAALPVIVWISGGGYLNCNSANPHFAGDALAAAGAVVVSAHYRSGFEGLARVAGAPDNRALLDQVAALRWVQDNIAGFGGDPDNVTVLGQSAGAGSIAALLLMPAAAGTFRRAVLQSIPQTYFTPGFAEDIAAEICSEVGRRPTLADLAGVAPDDLVAAAETVNDRLPQSMDRWGPLAYTTTPFSPIVDGSTLSSTPWPALAAGAARDVELLIGHTRDEYRLLEAELPATDDAHAHALIDGLTPTPGARQYREAYPTATPRRLRETALSDWLYRMPALHLAEAAESGGARVWLYELRWGFGPQGASHGLDTLLVFGTVDVNREVTAAGPSTVAEAGELSASMRAELLAFATTGDPGWPRFRVGERSTRVYDPGRDVVPYPEAQSRALWSNQRFEPWSAGTQS